MSRGGLPVVHLRHTRPYFGLLAAFVKHCLPARAWKTDYATAANVFGLLWFGFETLGSEAVIVLESDLEPSYDFYDYFKWAHREVLRQPELAETVWSINGFSDPTAQVPGAVGAAAQTEEETAGDPAARGQPGVDPLYRMYADGFMVWGWCTSRRVWPLLQRGWTWFDNWDWAMQAARKRSGRVSLSPRVSRIRNVGMKGINFDVQEGTAAAQRWLAAPLPGPEGEPYRYATQPLVVDPVVSATRANR